MLTIKYVDEFGNESILQCERTSYYPKDPDGGPCVVAFGCVPLFSDIIRDGTAIFRDGGKVFIMNDAGATVGKYVLQSPRQGETMGNRRIETEGTQKADRGPARTYTDHNVAAKAAGDAVARGHAADRQGTAPANVQMPSGTSGMHSTGNNDADNDGC